MLHLTPRVKRILLLWAGMWIVGFLSGIGGGGLVDWLDFDPLALRRLEFTSLPGALGYVLIHDRADLFHLLINAWIFALFAPAVEELLPARRFWIFLLKAALAGAAACLLLSWLNPSQFGIPVIGGSGLVSAVMAAAAALYPGRVLNLLLFRARLISVFTVLILLDFVFFLGNCFGEFDGVAHHVHLAGAAVGWLTFDGFHRVQGPWHGWLRRREEAKRQRKARQESADEAELDRILAKISREGLPSLTDSERSFLEKRSKS